MSRNVQIMMPSEEEEPARENNPAPRSSRVPDSPSLAFGLAPAHEASYAPPPAAAPPRQSQQGVHFGAGEGSYADEPSPPRAAMRPMSAHPNALRGSEMADGGSANRSHSTEGKAGVLLRPKSAQEKVAILVAEKRGEVKRLEQQLQRDEERIKEQRAASAARKTSTSRPTDDFGDSDDMGDTINSASYRPSAIFAPVAAASRPASAASVGGGVGQGPTEGGRVSFGGASALAPGGTGARGSGGRPAGALKVSTSGAAGDWQGTGAGMSRFATQSYNGATGSGGGGSFGAGDAMLGYGADNRAAGGSWDDGLSPTSGWGQGSAHTSPLTSPVGATSANGRGGVQFSLPNGGYGRPVSAMVPGQKPPALSLDGGMWQAGAGGGLPPHVAMLVKQQQQQQQAAAHLRKL